MNMPYDLEVWTEALYSGLVDLEPRKIVSGVAITLLTMLAYYALRQGVRVPGAVRRRLWPSLSPSAECKALCDSIAASFCVRGVEYRPAGQPAVANATAFMNGQMTLVVHGREILDMKVSGIDPRDVLVGWEVEEVRKAAAARVARQEHEELASSKALLLSSLSSQPVFQQSVPDVSGWVGSKAVIMGLLDPTNATPMTQAPKENKAPVANVPAPANNNSVPAPNRTASKMPVYLGSQRNV